MVIKHFYKIGCVIFLTFLFGCLPARLNKYRSASGSDGSPGSSRTSLFGSSDSQNDTQSSQANGYSSGYGNKNSQSSSTIYALDNRMFRFRLGDNQVGDAALDVLLRNYNLTIVDRKSGVITTEWDTFYLKNAVFRNKVSIRVRRNGWNSVDLVIHNNVEKLRDAAEAAGTVGAVWLPTSDEADEVSRIIQNMAIVLNQPPPVMPPRSNYAKKVGVEKP